MQQMITRLELYRKGGLALPDGFIPRPHQQEALAAIKEALQDTDSHRLLIEHPTGTGKTAIMAILACLNNTGRTLILSPSLSINHQNRRVIEQFATQQGKTVSFVGDDQRDISGDIIICTNASLIRGKTIASLKEGNITVAIADEGHHGLTEAFQSSLTDIFPSALKFAFSGTADISNQPGRRSNDCYPVTAHRLTIKEAIEQGLLPPLQIWRVPTGTELERLRTHKTASGEKDFLTADMITEINWRQRHRLLLDKYQEFWKDNPRILVFTVNIAEAENLAKMAAKRGIKAIAVHHKLGHKRLQQIYREILDGQYQMIANCTILSEGWDYPSLEAIIMEAPTLAHWLYMQRIGRLFRKDPDDPSKPKRVMDMVDICQHASLINAHHIFQKPTYVPGEFLFAPSKASKPSDGSREEDLITVSDIESKEMPVEIIDIGSPQAEGYHLIEPTQMCLQTVFLSAAGSSSQPEQAIRKFLFMKWENLSPYEFGGGDTGYERVKGQVFLSRLGKVNMTSLKNALSLAFGAELVEKVAAERKPIEATKACLRALFLHAFSEQETLTKEQIIEKLLTMSSAEFNHHKFGGNGSGYQIRAGAFLLKNFCDSTNIEDRKKLLGLAFGHKLVEKIAGQFVCLCQHSKVPEGEINSDFIHFLFLRTFGEDLADSKLKTILIIQRLWMMGSYEFNVFRFTLDPAKERTVIGATLLHKVCKNASRQARYQLLTLAFDSDTVDEAIALLSHRKILKPLSPSPINK